MRVKQLAKKLAVPSDTVRFYTRVGLLQPKVSPENGYNQYDQEDEKRLKFAVNARQLGFTVEDILEVIAAANGGNKRCPDVCQLIQKRLDENVRRFQESVRLREQLLQATDDWHSNANKKPSGKMVADLLQAFALNDSS